MAKNIPDAVREVCLSFPEAEEVPSRGSPDFRVRGKTFATFVVNHHGDGRIALWLPAPPGSQEFHAESEPEYFFVPPYMGPRGWLGVELDKGLDWARVAEQVRDAYVSVAPAELVDILGPPIVIEPPSETIDAVEFDPLNAPRAKELIPRLRDLCLSLPETSEGVRFGHPVWQAGKKSFAAAEHHDGRLRFTFWVGREAQGLLEDEERFEIPAYTGHHGWILLDVEDEVDWVEVQELLLGSYRHFALKRMLKELDGG